jgi:nucleolin
MFGRFGYVSYDNIDSATRAVESMNGKIYEGRRVLVNYAHVRSNNALSLPPSNTLYIGNLAFDITDRDLNDMFSDIRNVIDVRVAVDRSTGQPRGFAHAEFLDEPSATAAIEFLRNKAPYGRKLRVGYSREVRGNRQLRRRPNQQQGQFNLNQDVSVQA